MKIDACMRKFFMYFFWIVFGLIFLAYLVFRFAPMGLSKTDAQVEAYFKDALVEARAIGYQELIITLLDSLASLAVKHDAINEEAIGYIEEALTLAHNMENRWLVGHCLFSYGQLKMKNGQWLEAQTAFEQVLEIGSEVGVKELEAKSHFGLARVALAQKNITKALQEGQQSLIAFDSINHFQATEVAEWLQKNISVP